MFKKFECGNFTRYVDLTKIDFVAVDKDISVKVILCGAPCLVYEGYNTEEFAAELVKEIEATKKAAIDDIIAKNNAEVTENVRNICKDFGFDEVSSNKQIEYGASPVETGRLAVENGATINVDDIQVLYIGGDNFDEVRAIDGTREILIKKFKLGSIENRRANARDYIDKVHYGNDRLKTIRENDLYIDNSENIVDYVIVDKNDDIYEVNVIINLKKFFVKAFSDADDAFDYKRELDIEFGLN